MVTVRPWTCCFIPLSGSLAAKAFGANVVGVIMTGMGDDGADGLRAVQAAGGVTMAQSKESCVVDSMPRSAIDAGYVNRIVPLDAIPSVLQAVCLSDRLGTHVDAAELETHPRTQK